MALDDLKSQIITELAGQGQQTVNGYTVSYMEVHQRVIDSTRLRREAPGVADLYSVDRISHRFAVK